jgi:hypothetical protein
MVLLIIIAFVHGGPTFSLQEFNSMEQCNHVREKIINFVQQRDRLAPVKMWCEEVK